MLGMPAPVPHACPDCNAPLSPANAVRIEVSIHAGDDDAGQTITTRALACGACGQKLANRYAAAAQQVVSANAAAAASSR